jgi:Bacteriophage minor capsid protein
VGLTLVASDLAAWLNTSPIQWPVVPQGSSESVVAVRPGPYIDPLPDRLVTVTMRPGAGTLGEEQYEDRPGFQVRSRSAQGFESDGEQIAWAVDRWLRRFLPPVFTPGGTLIKAVDRTGGQPATLGPPDNSMRYVFTCNYIAIVGLDFGM